MTNEQTKTHEDFVLNVDGTEGIVWAETIKIVERNFPDAIANGILPLGRNTQTKRCTVDGSKADWSKAERVFRLETLGFEEQAVSLVGQYVELAEKQQSQKA